MKDFPESARMASAAKTSRRVAIREGALLAQRVRNRLMEAWLESTDGDPKSALSVAREVLEACKQTTDAYADEVDSKGTIRTGAKPGLRGGMSVEDAEKSLE